MESLNDRIEFQAIDKAFNRRIRTFAVVNKVHVDISEFLNDAFRIYQTELVRTLEEHNIIKTMAILVAEFEKKLYASDNNVASDNKNNSDHNSTESDQSNIRENENIHSNSDYNDDFDMFINENENENENEQANISGIDSEQTIKETLYFSTSNKIVGLGTDLHKHFKENIIDEVLKSVENTAIRGSGFTLSRIIKLDVQICSYDPLRGSSYIETPLKLFKKGAIVNVMNKHDDMCFKWSILSALYPAKHNPSRLQHYLKYENELNFDGIDFPVRLQDINKFVSQNKGISVNVYHYDEKNDCVHPLRVSTDVQEIHIHLLLLMEETNVPNYADTVAGNVKWMLSNANVQQHYCWINSLSRLVSKQLNKHQHKKYICDRCLNFFHVSNKLNDHLKYCPSEYMLKCLIMTPDGSNSRIMNIN